MQYKHTSLLVSEVMTAPPFDEAASTLENAITKFQLPHQSETEIDVRCAGI